MMRNILLSAFAVVLCVLPTRRAAGAEPVTVFAAASLGDCLKEATGLHQKKTGQLIRLNLGASSTLARQIEAGAPADLFFSADEAQMDKLQELSLIRTNSRVTRLSNTLVIVVPSDNPATFTSAAQLAQPAIKKIALAETKSVPAGIYAREYLTSQGLWRDLESKVVPTENVRAALAAVEAGNVEAAIVYKTDARISKRVRIACDIPAGEGPSIRYSLAITRDARSPAGAEQFEKFLSSPEAGDIFERFGFIVLPAAR